MSRAPRIGIVDSGGPARQMAGALAFPCNDETAPAKTDRLGHGSAVAAVILRAAPGAALIHAQVFDDRPITTAARVAAAVAWLTPQCDIITLALGLAADRAVLAAACTKAIRQGLVLVASVPARGGPCWPAAYPGVIAATGDARCGWAEVSALSAEIIGAWCGSPEHTGSGSDACSMGGASLAAARVAGHLAAGGPAAWTDAASWLRARARFKGAERRLPDAQSALSLSA